MRIAANCSIESRGCHPRRVNPARFRTATLIVAALLVAFGVSLATGLIEDDDPASEEAPSTAAETTAPATGDDDVEDTDAVEEEGAELPRIEDDPEGLEPGPSGPAPSSGDEVAAADAARSYVEAIDARNGRRVCSALAPGALRSLDLPAEGGSCPAALEASFGSGEQRGQPVWKSSEMTNDVAAEINGDSARVVATVFTEYADEREPTIEDDIVYLTRLGKRWLIVKPSATLYRAVGIAEIPLDALREP